MPDGFDEKIIGYIYGDLQMTPGDFAVNNLVI